MARIPLLLFSFLTLSDSQIIYPDQYEMMRTSTVPPYVYTNGARGSNSNNFNILYNQESVQQIGPTQASVYSLFPTTNQPIYYSAKIYPTTTVAANPQTLPQNWNDHVNNIISRGIMKFSLDLDKAVYNTKAMSTTGHPENVIFSPLSVSVALSLVLLGSAGRTFDEISQVLGLESGVDISRHSEIVHQMFGMMLSIIDNKVEGSNLPQVNSASGIFVQEGYPIRPEFRAISERAYKSEVINLDFQRRGKEAQDIINNWVKQRTMGKIDSILQDEPNPITNVILLSALYFKGEWNQHFLEGATKRKRFFVEPNNAINVDMMFNGGTFPFYEDKSLGVKILALPYKGLEMSMYVLLPKAEGATALKNFQNQLTVETIEYLINNLKNQTCIVGLPHMKISSTLSLNKALKNMGLQSLFDAGTSDLSLLSNGYGFQQAPAAITRPFTIPQVIPTAITSPLSIPQRLPQGFPQGLQQGLPQGSQQGLPQGSQPELPQGSQQGLPQGSQQGLPQGSQQGLPQGSQQGLPQGSQQWLSQGSQQDLPQESYQGLPQGSQQRSPQKTQFPQRAEQGLPQRSQQDLSQVSNPGSVLPTNNDYLIFSRTGENNGIRGATERSNYVRYDDKQRSIAVEQWNTGFQIRKLRRTRRDVIGGHGNNDRLNRKKRQTRPIDENFLRFIESQNFPFYGLDDLRNNANLMNPGLFAEEVLHKVEMEVTERGTEAAAVTGVLLERDGNQKRLVANRPFLFFIRHDPTKLLLFWGTINKPTPNYSVVR